MHDLVLANDVPIEVCHDDADVRIRDEDDGDAIEKLHREGFNVVQVFLGFGRVVHNPIEYRDVPS